MRARQKILRSASRMRKSDSDTKTQVHRCGGQSFAVDTCRVPNGAHAPTRMNKIQYEITVPCRTASMPFKGRSRCCGGLFLYRRPALAEGRAFLLLVGAEQSRQACGLNVPCPLLIYNPNSVETGGVVCRFMHERLQHCMPWFVRSCRMSRRNESQD